MKTQCQRCNQPLGQQDEAFICSFECTFCSDCATQALVGVCPNCQGDLQRRPKREKTAL